MPDQPIPVVLEIGNVRLKQAAGSLPFGPLSIEVVPECSALYLRTFGSVS